MTAHCARCIYKKKRKIKNLIFAKVTTKKKKKRKKK